MFYKLIRFSFRSLPSQLALRFFLPFAPTTAQFLSELGHRFLRFFASHRLNQRPIFQGHVLIQALIFIPSLIYHFLAVLQRGLIYFTQLQPKFSLMLHHLFLCVKKRPVLHAPLNALLTRKPPSRQ